MEFVVIDVQSVNGQSEADFFKTVVITSACWLLIRSVAFGNCELERIELRIICALTTNWTRKHLELEMIKKRQKSKKQLILIEAEN